NENGNECSKNERKKYGLSILIPTVKILGRFYFYTEGYNEGRLPLQLFPLLKYPIFFKKKS
ncbi:hypothetical protein C1646_698812, partial [Rhizophagus diaphanus]